MRIGYLLVSHIVTSPVHVQVSTVQKVPQTGKNES
jgi:hypothetical protein